jgi:hypothetical protein
MHGRLDHFRNLGSGCGKSRNPGLAKRPFSIPRIPVTYYYSWSGRDSNRDLRLGQVQHSTPPTCTFAHRQQAGGGFRTDRSAAFHPDDRRCVRSSWCAHHKNAFHVHHIHLPGWRPPGSAHHESDSAQRVLANRRRFDCRALSISQRSRRTFRANGPACCSDGELSPRSQSSARLKNGGPDDRSSPRHPFICSRCHGERLISETPAENARRF